MTPEALRVAVLLSFALFAALYGAHIRSYHRRRGARLGDPERCPETGDPHLWQGCYQYPPPKGPREEECITCLAKRVVVYEGPARAVRVLRYEA